MRGGREVSQPYGVQPGKTFPSPLSARLGKDYLSLLGRSVVGSKETPHDRSKLHQQHLVNNTSVFALSSGSSLPA